ncbi:hypothetical protein [Paenarthrobacter nicotinovorans]|uniref:hypothetical protein n=1 Tax=Paenarthrobacter nicotinovorans TaxID=29320 RepID=UPI003D67233E
MPISTDGDASAFLERECVSFLTREVLAFHAKVESYTELLQLALPDAAARMKLINLAVVGVVADEISEWIAARPEKQS